MKKTNIRLRCPDLSSLDASAQATEPAGYSPPIPTPIKKRYAVRAASIPGIEPPAPQEPEQRMENKIRILVETSMPSLRE